MGDQFEVVRLEISKLELRPKDILVMKLAHDLPQEQVEELRKLTEEFLKTRGYSNVVMLIGPEIEMSVVTERLADHGVNAIVDGDAGVPTIINRGEFWVCARDDGLCASPAKCQIAGECVHWWKR